VCARNRILVWQIVGKTNFPQGEKKEETTIEWCAARDKVYFFFECCGIFWKIWCVLQSREYKAVEPNAIQYF
jgi:hypothetical protein